MSPHHHWFFPSRRVQNVAHFHSKKEGLRQQQPTCFSSVTPAVMLKKGGEAILITAFCKSDQNTIAPLLPTWDSMKKAVTLPLPLTLAPFPAGSCCAASSNTQGGWTMLGAESCLEHLHPGFVFEEVVRWKAADDNAQDTSMVQWDMPHHGTA